MIIITLCSWLIGPFKMTFPYVKLRQRSIFILLSVSVCQHLFSQLDEEEL
jgi:hypothetical protein